MAPLKQKYKHKEAFCLMKYASKDGKITETLWNSRDGVTPFVIGSKDGVTTLEHTDWKEDARVTNYVPAVGDRIFVNLTWASATKSALEFLKKWWDNPKQPASKAYEGMTLEEAAEARAKDAMLNPAQPDIVVVTADMHDAFLRKASNAADDNWKTQEQKRAAAEEAEAVYQEFWKPLLEVDGKLDIDLVKLELRDFRVFMDEVAKVFDHVSGGMISKPNTKAHEVIDAHDERREREIEEAITDYLEANKNRPKPEAIEEAKKPAPVKITSADGKDCGGYAGQRLLLPSEHHFHTPETTEPMGPQEPGGGQIHTVRILNGLSVCCRCGRTVIVDPTAPKECVGPFVQKSRVPTSSDGWSGPVRKDR